MKTSDRIRDVIVAGGGIAGAVLGGVLARAGVDVLVLEKEPAFRDRIRGEATLPRGMREVHRLGVFHLFEEVRASPLTALRLYDQEGVGTNIPWGTEVRRPVKVVDVALTNGHVRATTDREGLISDLDARLVVGADGKLSKARTWTGGGSAADLEHHRFGGVAVSGVSNVDRDTDNVAGEPGVWINWFERGQGSSRLYVCIDRDRLKASRAHGSFDALLALARHHAPEGTLVDEQQEGPIGFFSNNDTWGTRVAGNHVALIGDAAGSPDPTKGHGTSLVFRDVRELSGLLLADEDWGSAIEEYARRRIVYFDVIRQVDLWSCVLEMEIGERADRLREGNERAEAEDPSLGGFRHLDVEGPDGLMADGAAALAFFGGEHLAPR